MTTLLLLPTRRVLSLSGPDRVRFLQGLVSNDVAAAGPDRLIHAAFLTAQGKFLHDLIIGGTGDGADGATGDRLLLDVDAARAEDFQTRLMKYRLRSKIELTDTGTSLAVAVVFGTGASARFGLPETPGAAQPFGAGGLVGVDPRSAGLGVRLIVPAERAPDLADTLGLAPGTAEAYDRLRIGLGVPDGHRDLIVEKSILLENNYDIFHGVSWTKGCYLGQELTARTKYRALIKKRLMPVAIDGPLPAPGTPILHGTTEAGEMRSGVPGLGLALLRLEVVAAAAAEGTPLLAGDSRLHPLPMPLPEPAKAGTTPMP